MERPSFIGNYKDLFGADDSHYEGDSELMSIGAPVGKLLGLQKIGIHIELIHPGRRTSWPHAESAEEEFAFVLEGHPDVWINGVLHPLAPGDFVAFPAGTGIAHTFLNNTDKNVLLLVGGERPKKENKIIYPINPDANEKRKARGDFWDDCPKQTLGPHDGKARKNTKVVE
ncbi:cupin domain-containing protein [Bacteriovorax stolpii]|uniref:Cupin n=1 Tax=Bacteriovorax stolpii TaxID=960 RepID=A0A2K9NWF0_BACTC|nr:cupin domain-containing protein [Bacteriovorax stolpii]AUN99837.1 cupin [Bacteriovorax stolpii]QDK40170.1 cupin domain-containing protein [Bacteriovorax stolpii]TDP54271.1 hypothetical protein C8D79_1565 [Bacteriovorax stolpii]